MIKLKDAFTFNKTVSPVCVAHSDDPDYERYVAFIMGWGAAADLLQEAPVSTVSFD